MANNIGLQLAGIAQGVNISGWMRKKGE